MTTPVDHIHLLELIVFIHWAIYLSFDEIKNILKQHLILIFIYMLLLSWLLLSDNVMKLRLKPITGVYYPLLGMLFDIKYILKIYIHME